MKKDKTDIIKGIAFVSQFAVIMLSPIVMCLFLGKWLDKVFSTGHVLTLIFILLGIGAAYRNAYITLRDYMKNGKNGEGTDDDTKER